MADLPVTPLADYGSLLSSIPLANSTIDTQTAQQGLTKAQVPMVQAQTQGIQLQNQRTKMLLDAIAQRQQSMDQSGTNNQAQQYPGAPNPVTRPTAGEGDLTLDDAGLDPASISSHAQQQYAVKKYYTPQEQSDTNNAPLYTALGMPGMRESAEASSQERFINQTSAAQLKADSAYKKAYAISTSDPGTALYAGLTGEPLGALAKTDPQAAAKLLALAKQKFPHDADKANKWADQMARTVANEIGNAVHQYSGRDIHIGEDKIAYDKATHQPLLNGNPEGLSAQQFADLETKAHATVERISHGAPTKMEQWEADGAASPAAWAIHTAAQARLAQSQAMGPVAAPTTSPQGGPLVQPPVSTAGSRASSPPPPQPATPSPAPAPVPAAPPSAAATPSGASAMPSNQLTPQEQAFIQKSPGMPAATDTGSRAPNKYEEGVATDVGKARGTLLASSIKAQQEANDTLATVARVNSLVSDPKMKLGPGSDFFAKTQTAVQTWGPRWVSEMMGDPSSYQVLKKVLTTDQLNTILKEFHNEGAQVRLGAYETRAIMNYMSANPELARAAIQKMMSWESADAQYNFHKGTTGIAYVNAGKDPTQFAYGGSFPRPTVDKPSSSARIIVTGKESYEALKKGDAYDWNGKYGVKS